LQPGVIRICDACFACRPAWRRAVLRGLAGAGLTTRLWAETRVDGLTAEDLDLAASLDLFLNFGVETLSPAIAVAMRKDHDGVRYVRRVDRVLREINERRLLAKVYLLFNHPGETEATARETVAYVERFIDEHDHLSLIFNAQPYAFFPGSDVARRQAHYEDTYGMSVVHPAWWREWLPHHELAVQVRGTPGFTAGQEHADRVRALFPRARAKMPPSVLVKVIAHAVPG
jgi:hypothetical protein